MNEYPSKEGAAALRSLRISAEPTELALCGEARISECTQSRKDSKQGRERGDLYVECDTPKMNTNAQPSDRR